MKKIVDFEKVEEVSKLMKNKCNTLEEELNKILLSLNKIKEVDKTDNMTLLLDRYNNTVNELKKFINVMDYYTNYMENTSNYYNITFNDYNRKLENSLMEIGAFNGKNRV